MAKFTVDIPVGPIWNQKDAEEKCPIVCAAHLGEWNGQWSTPKTSWGKMSVCTCVFKS